MSNEDESATWGEVEVSIAIFQSIICLGCIVFVLYICCTTPRRKWSAERESTSSMIPLCTFLGLFSFLISSMSLGSFYWNWIIALPSFIETVEFQTTLFCWSFGQFCSYLVFVLRLIDTFSNSTLKVSRNTIIFLVILVVLYEIAWITICIAPFVFSWSTTNSERYPIYMIIPTLFLDVLITITMTYIFISRLFSVMRGQAETVRDQQLRNEALNQSLNADGANYQFMRLSVKIAVLSITSLLSSLAFVSLDALSTYYQWEHSMRWLLYWWLQIDIVITCFCLTLFLARTEKVYNMLCCCCIFIGQRWMRRMLLRNERRETSTESGSETSLKVTSGETNSIMSKLSGQMLTQTESTSLQEPLPMQHIN